MASNPTSPENIMREVVGATGSARRREGLAEVVGWIVAECSKSGQGINYDVLVHILSPDKDANIPESDVPNPAEVAWQKTLVVAYALGLLAKADIPNELLESWQGVIKMFANPEEILIRGGEDVLIYGGDVVTAVRPNELGTGLTELLKLERQLVDKTEKEQTRIIAADQKMIKEIFCNPDGFFVKFEAGIALLSAVAAKGNRGLTTSWDMVAKFKALPEALVENAYEIGPEGEKIGSAYKIGPRLDIASLALENDKNGQPLYLDGSFGLWVKNSIDNDDCYLPLEAQLMVKLVVGGLLSPQMCLELLLKLDEQPLGEQPLLPNPVILQIHRSN